LFGLIMASIFNRTLHSELERTKLAPGVIEAVEQQRSKLAAIELPGSMDADATAVAKQAIADAFVAGFRWIMLISAALALASAASAWILIGSASGGHRATGPPHD
jgi:hypothetical protein